VNLNTYVRRREKLMRLKVKKTCIILLVLLFIPQILLASGDAERIKTLKKDREVWSAKSKVLNKYSEEFM
jgi:hypothetical protein